MKIEMGESLFYSWLRHYKKCQIVQTNWKVSGQWDMSNISELENLMEKIDSFFSSKYGYRIFKGNSSLKQLVQQGECDVIGLHSEAGKNDYYAIDVAFHEAGLQYGDKDTTIMKVLEKCARTAFCLYGYLNVKDAEIIFASPKINAAVLTVLEPCISELNDSFADAGFDYAFCIITNEEFNNQVLQPILDASNGISDTSELFLRSYQLFRMFANEKPVPHVKKQSIPKHPTTVHEDAEYIPSDAYCEFKIGQLAQRVLGKMLKDGCASESEIAAMQTAEYSKQNFDIQYPLLAKAGTGFDRVRYYAKPIVINGQEYYMCSQWFEVPANNDRPYLVK